MGWNMHTRTRHIRTGLLIGAGMCLILLAGCNSDAVKPVSNNEFDQNNKYFKNGTLSGDDSLFSFGRSNKTDDAGGALGVNAYLWRGALDTLSFMPLQSADPFGGVIITDWYTPPASNGERFKATAYILGRQLRADGIRVSIFRQVQQGGQWVDAPISPATATDIENKVLARARELRTQSAGAS